MCIVCRRDEAKLLGYPTFADISMETKMVGTLQNAEDHLAQLLSKGKYILSTGKVLCPNYTCEM